MSNYKLLPRHFKNAKSLNVEIVPSSNPKKKIDVYTTDGTKYSIGSYPNMDYAYYLADADLAKTEKLKQQLTRYANLRRQQYLLRHKKNNGKAGFYAKRILWQ